MSRIGKKIIDLPAGVAVSVADHVATVQGPKGTLIVPFPHAVTVAQTNNQVFVTIENEANRTQGAYWGLVRSLVANAVTGVSTGFTKELEVNGVGYKVQLKGKDLQLNVGYSHPVLFSIPDGIICVVEANKITLSGIDKQLLGETAAQIRKIRKPEPYKGKGIKYVEEVLRRKEGKVVKGSE